MNNRKNTRRALFASVISMLLCVTMLVGSTFAWFTDNASTAVSNIVSGTLDIELLDGKGTNANSLEGKTLTFAKAAGGAGETVLFEPGAKYSLQQVWLHNAGNLHAKYQITITGIDGSSKLAEALDVYVGGTNVGTLASLLVNGGVINSSVIAPGEYYSFGTIELEMKTSAGNEYQGLTMDGIAITVQATQATVEYDSEDNQYDAGATFDKVVEATNQAELNEAVAEAEGPVALVLAEGTYTLPNLNSKNVTISGTKNTVIDLTNGTPSSNGATIAFEGVTVKFSENGNYQGFTHSTKVVYKDCGIEGTTYLYSPTTFVGCALKVNDGYNVWTYGSDASFSNCSFDTQGRAILVYNQGEVHNTVTVENCSFTDGGGYSKGPKAAVEVGKSEYSTATTFNIIIRNCTVTGFEKNNSTSALWGNKNSMDKDHLNVVIDGVDVY